MEERENLHIGVMHFISFFLEYVHARSFTFYSLTAGAASPAPTYLPTYLAENFLENLQHGSFFFFLPLTFRVQYPSRHLGFHIPHPVSLSSISYNLPTSLHTQPEKNEAMGLNAAARLMGGYASLRTSSTESESGDPSDDKDRPLLPKEEEDLDTVPLHRLHHHKRKTSWARRHPFLIHGVLLILNLLVAISYGFWSFSSCVVDPAHRYCMFHLLPPFTI